MSNNNFNQFKSTTIRGTFNNLDYPDGSINASAFFARDITIGGTTTTNTLNSTNNITVNGVIVGCGKTTGLDNNVGIGGGLLQNLTGNNNISIGQNSLYGSAASIRNVAIGPYSMASTSDRSGCTAIGYSAKCFMNFGIALGYSSSISGLNSIAIGGNSIANFNNSIAFGYGVSTTIANEIMMGSSTQFVNIPNILKLSTIPNVFTYLTSLSGTIASISGSLTPSSNISVNNITSNNNLIIQTGGASSGNVSLTIKTGDALGTVDVNSCSYTLSNNLGSHFFNTGIAINGLIYTNNNISCVGNVDCATINSINAYYYDPTSSIQSQFDSFTTQMTLFTGLYALKASPTFTGTPLAPTAATATNTTQIATTAYVKSNLSTYALLASPTFTGTPLAPTPASTVNTTQIATTAYVKSNLATYALLASPTFTGTPLSTTAIAGTNTTQIATCAFVNSAITTSSSSILSTNNTWSGTQTFNATITTVQNLAASTITEGATALASKYAQLALSNTYATGTTNAFQALTATTFMGKTASFFDPTSSIQTQLNGLQPLLNTGTSNIFINNLSVSGTITGNLYGTTTFGSMSTITNVDMNCIIKFHSPIYNDIGLFPYLSTYIATINGSPNYIGYQQTTILTITGGAASNTILFGTGAATFNTASYFGIYSINVYFKVGITSTTAADFGSAAICSSTFSSSSTTGTIYSCCGYNNNMMSVNNATWFNMHYIYQYYTNTPLYLGIFFNHFNSCSVQYIITRIA
jgi:hypothetical protein